MDQTVVTHRFLCRTAPLVSQGLGLVSVTGGRWENSATNKYACATVMVPLVPFEPSALMLA